MLNDALSIYKLLCQESSGSKHTETSILKFLVLHCDELLLGFRLQAKRIKSNVTRDVFGTKLTRLVIGDILRFNPSNLSTN